MRKTDPNAETCHKCQTKKEPFPLYHLDDGTHTYTGVEYVCPNQHLHG